MTDQQPVASNPLDSLKEEHEVFLEVLRNVRPEQMGLPTPDYGTTWVVVYHPAETLTPAPAGCTLTWSER